MRAQDADGRELEFFVYGTASDDLQVDEIYYLDTDEPVDDSVIDYVLDRYAVEIAEDWYAAQVDAAELFADCTEDM